MTGLTGGFRDQHGAVTDSMQDPPEPVPEPEPDPDGFLRSLTDEELRALAENGPGVREVSDAKNKPAWASAMSRAMNHHIRKGEAIRLAIEEAERREAAAREARGAREGVTMGAPRQTAVGGLTQRQVRLLLLVGGAGVLLWKLSGGDE